MPGPSMVISLRARFFHSLPADHRDLALLLPFEGVGADVDDAAAVMWIVRGPAHELAVAAARQMRDQALDSRRASR